MDLLRTLCSIQAPSGDESALTEFLLQYIEDHKRNWKHKPKVYHGGLLQDAIVLSFGKPRTAIFAHIDSIGFTVRYGNQLVKIGGPVTDNGIVLVGKDSQGEVEVTLNTPENAKFFQFDSTREIDRGTNLTFKPNFRETDEFVQCCYMDNRLGVYNALKVAESLKNGLIVFSCREEHSGGSTAYIGRWIAEKFKVHQALISDITWVTEGVEHGKGVVVSMRDSGLPRRTFLNRIIDLAKKSGIPFQLEVEGSGGSDGIELQRNSDSWEWCFVGAPESNVHSPDEKVHQDDIQSMIELYRWLMKEL
ncbi:MAG: M20/M25/M40 family metallo-hydrolase [Bacteroidia bacterium]|nr:M20/M25/M40 family metallo-hydrolase [Bacteroidia bacterium]